MNREEIKTLTDAKIFVRQYFNAGKSVTCPCCDQLVKLYHRSIHPRMARALIQLHRLTIYDNRYYHVAEIGADKLGGDFAKLRYWGLITAMPNTDKSKRASGYWKITPYGTSFVLGQVKISKYRYMYNSRVFGFSEETIDIFEALNDKFDYSELMKETPPGRFLA